MAPFAGLSAKQHAYRSSCLDVGHDTSLSQCSMSCDICGISFSFQIWLSLKAWMALQCRQPIGLLDCWAEIIRLNLGDLSKHGWRGILLSARFVELMARLALLCMPFHSKISFTVHLCCHGSCDVSFFRRYTMYPQQFQGFTRLPRGIL